MLKQLNLVDLFKAIQTKVEDKTGLKCLDFVKENEKAPFYFMELVRPTPANTKTMYIVNYEVWIHSIAEESNSSIPIFNMLTNLDEALSEDIELPEGFELVLQTNNGVQTLKTDETNEKHAVTSFTFKVCYGFMCK